MPPFAVELVWLIAGILIVGAILWGLSSLPGIDETFKQVARVICIVALVIWCIWVLASLVTGLPLPNRR